jgi:hypothetical protein
MSGFVMVVGTCCACNKPCSFNPHFVPSIPVEGIKQPVCQDCIINGNRERVKLGLKPHFVHPQAYEPLPESEL